MSQSDAEGSPRGLPSGQQRKRVKRACDKCCRSKARCDGRKPCRHCEDYGYSCAYTRERRKRGRRSEAANSSTAADSSVLSYQSQQSTPAERFDSVNDSHNGGDVHQSESTRPEVELGSPEGNTLAAQSPGASPNSPSEPSALQATPIRPPNVTENYTDHSDSGLIEDRDFHLFGVSGDMSHLLNVNPFLWDLASGFDNSTGKDSGAVYYHLDERQASSTESMAFDSHIHSQIPDSSQESSHSTNSISPSTQVDIADPYSLNLREKDTATVLPPSNRHCRYSVLLPLVPYLKSFIAISEACDLLDLYFTEPSNSLFSCASPYVITQIFRKDLFLKNDRPRKTSKALLAAMLWATAQTSDSPIFTDDPCARPLICDKLYFLCLEFLSFPKPKYPIEAIPRGSHTRYNNMSGMRDSRPTRTLDDVLTYSLIGLVISGRENTKDCLIWWNQAWALAKELNLNCELEDTNPRNSSSSLKTNNLPPASNLESILAIQEVKEERRRVWWLLYIADRHLALCYNTPLKILDVECHIYQPLDDAVWQDLENHLKRGLPDRYPGPSTTMTGVGLFEYFLPLIAILGDIIDIHHQKLHPRFGHLDRSATIMQIEQSLAIYEASLKSFEESVALRFPDIGHSLSYSSPQTIFNAYRDIRPWSPEEIRLKTVIGYSNYLLHVLHILLHGNWDPLSMLGGMDPWVMPQSFANCATRAISAVAAVSEILKVDPELSFMPYLFGIYLLHGSFILLIFADRMDMATSDIISRACETMIRAHEVCVTTLTTEYQRTFRKILRSALNTVSGTITADMDQYKARRRAFLTRYRWNVGGRGLAI